jgi:hypothetical protein
MGIIRAIGRGNLGIEENEDFIQTDAATNPAIREERSWIKELHRQLSSEEEKARDDMALRNRCFRHWVLLGLT